MYCTVPVPGTSTYRQYSIYDRYAITSNGYQVIAVIHNIVCADIEPHSFDMKPLWLISSFAALLCSIFPLTLEAQCSDSGNKTCATVFNRTCFADDTCAACLDGYISFKNQTSCFAIDDIDWETFIQLFNPSYKGGDLTQEQRLQLLIAIAKFVSAHNAANSSNFELEINRFSADSPDDTRDRTGYVYIEDSEGDLEDDFATQLSTDNDTIPARVNWVEQGAVTLVKDQGRCGLLGHLSRGSH